MFSVFIALTIAGWFIWFLWDQWKIPKHSPPGPARLPIIGNLVHILLRKGEKMPAEVFQDYSKEYGPVMTFKIGVLDQVILNDLQIVKDISNSDIWLGRFYDDWIARRAFGKELGLLVVSGPVWKEMRRFTIRTLRDFGFGKQKSMETTIQEELDELIKSMTHAISQGGGQFIVNMKQYFTISVLNILWVMLAGNRFCHDDQKLHRLLALMDKFLSANALGSVALTFYTAFPIFQRFLPNLTSYGQQRYALDKELQEFFRDLLEERRAEGLYKEEQRDFIDVFLNQIDAHKNDSADTNFYTDEQFIVVTMDLFMAGSETTSNTIEFAILYMVLHPEIQKKVQAEIDSVVGTSQFLSILDKAKLPYTEATLLEVQRLASILPINLRSNTQDTTIGKYHIPKGTLGIINVYGIHRDPTLWENPEVFNPNRFLDESGNIINAHKIIPFGAGCRGCIGEKLARATLFTFFTTFLQRFSFEASPNHAKPTMKPSLGFTLSPRPYYGRVIARS